MYKRLFVLKACGNSDNLMSATEYARMHDCMEMSVFVVISPKIKKIVYE